MFDENSGLVIIWIRLLTQENSSYTIEDVPNLSNLKIIVQEILDKKERME